MVNIAHGVKQRYKVRVIGGEVAEDLFNRGLCLPSGTATKEEDLERVIFGDTGNQKIVGLRYHKL